ncbi:response regulator [Paraburkholderia sp. ZP32-5]|uniref:response regulator n=1 Tax=Paraburkholderia sp. ZP32-5 TaxID=2883245 RepID=UPI001F20F85A|nr:response regulator [Paraburkholderia sp. ZP32-5]
MANLRIILADDHPFALLGYRSTLATCDGVTIVGDAHTPAGLIALLQRTRCDMLISDLSMADPAGVIEDGVSLMLRIRRDWPALRVVVATAQTNPAVLRVLAADSALSVFGKADPLTELQQAISESARGTRYLSRSIVALLAQSHIQVHTQAPAYHDAHRAVSVPHLSARQIEIVRRLVWGESIAQIAAALGCHPRTISRQKREVMTCFGVTDNAGLFSCVRALEMFSRDQDSDAWATDDSPAISERSYVLGIRNLQPLR